MNPLQLAQQIAHELRRVTWPDGAQELVFGSAVAVFAGNPGDAIPPESYPWAMVGLGNGENDEEDPDVITQTLVVACAAEVAGDPAGEFAVIGGAIGGAGSSAGRGIGEISARVRAALRAVHDASGTALVVRQTSAGAPTALRDEDGNEWHGALEEMAVQAVCVADPYYLPPQRLRVESGFLRWDGARCAARFDFVQFHLLELAGTAPSADPEDGDVLYSGTAMEFEHTAETGHTYTVFAEYNGRLSVGVVEGVSSPDVGAYYVVE